MLGLPDYLEQLARGVILTVTALGWVLVMVRVTGLRAFSKMTAFDFVITVAAGSLLATAGTVSSWTAFVQALAAIAGLFAAQIVLAKLRKNSKLARGAIHNQPVLLMRDGKFCEAAMQATRVARSDVIAKLREANAIRLDQVRAVVLETTGDISVLHGEEVESRLLEDVRTCG